MNDDRGLQVDFMPLIHGVKSFNSLSSRALMLLLKNPLQTRSTAVSQTHYWLRSLKKAAVPAASASTSAATSV